MVKRSQELRALIEANGAMYKQSREWVTFGPTRRLCRRRSIGPVLLHELTFRILGSRHRWLPVGRRFPPNRSRNVSASSRLAKQNTT
jgi:hypothetical protein